MSTWVLKFVTGVALALTAWSAATAGAEDAAAKRLTVVNVAAPEIYCVFNVSCYVSVTDTGGLFPARPGYSGNARLVTRTFYGASGAQGDGLVAYLYRVDFTKAVATSTATCATRVKVNFGAIVRLDYDGSGPSDVFVISSGELGSVGLASAVRVGHEVTLTFASPICPQQKTSPGLSSFYIGMAASPLPSGDKATVDLTVGSVAVKARMPDFQP